MMPLSASEAMAFYDMPEGGAAWATSSPNRAFLHACHACYAMRRGKRMHGAYHVPYRRMQLGQVSNDDGAALAFEVRLRAPRPEAAQLAHLALVHHTGGGGMAKSRHMRQARSPEVAPLGLHAFRSSCTPWYRSTDQPGGMSKGRVAWAWAMGCGAVGRRGGGRMLLAAPPCHRHQRLAAWCARSLAGEGPCPCMRCTAALQARRLCGGALWGGMPPAPWRRCFRNRCRRLIILGGPVEASISSVCALWGLP